MKKQSALKFVKERSGSLRRNDNTKFTDIERIVCSLLSLTQAKLHSNVTTISENQKKLVNLMIARRNSGEPLAYILKKKGFWNINVKVNRHVLVPRPETETLIEAILDLFNEDRITVLDLGTGSGIIALTLATERREWEIFASDISFKALRVASHNKDKYHANVKLIQANWLDIFKVNSFDLIISNPPYIAEREENLKEDGLKFEPRLALVSKEKGMRDLKEICTLSYPYLKKGGRIFLEHAPWQTEKVRHYLKRPDYSDLKVIKDLNGDKRVTGALKL